MALLADDQRFAAACRHDFLPYWHFSTPFIFQICEFADMVNLYILRRATELAFIRQEPSQYFGASYLVDIWSVIEDCSRLSGEGNSSEPSNEGWLVLAFSLDFQAGEGFFPFRGLCFGLVLGVHGCYRRLVLAGQRFHE